MYYVYALKALSHDRIYIGFTKDLDIRIAEHNAGRTKSTQYYRPWELFYHEECDTRLSARKAEKILKTTSGRMFLKRILKKRPCSSVG